MVLKVLFLNKLFLQLERDISLLDSLCLHAT